MITQRSHIIRYWYDSSCSKHITEYYKTIIVDDYIDRDPYTINGFVCEIDVDRTWIKFNITVI